jgi:outer membrane protein assembly factor BamB
LKVKWRFSFRGADTPGVFSSTPISLNGTVDLQDLNSNVLALDRSTGTVKWEDAFNQPGVGPNGVATAGTVYAFDTDRPFGSSPTRARSYPSTDQRGSPR